jgi:hypothetical protein
MGFADTCRYIRHRVKTAGSPNPIFSIDALAAIYYYSDGFPRRINVICDMSLVYAFADSSKTITANIVTDVVKDRSTFTILRNLQGNNKSARKVKRWLAVRGMPVYEKP